MSRTWRKRTVVAVLSWAAVSALAWWFRMGPDLAVLAGLVLAVNALFWVGKDVGAVADNGFWACTSTTRYARGRGSDYRLGHLRRYVAEALGTGASGSDRLRPVLVDLVEERLRAHRGTDLQAAPGALRTLLGPGLHDYLSDAEAHRRLERSELAGFIDRIESL